jgi:hypothetical protein
MKKDIRNSYKNTVGHLGDLSIDGRNMRGVEWIHLIRIETTGRFF